MCISPEMYNEFIKTNKENARNSRCNSHDVVVIHDPQPGIFGGNGEGQSGCGSATFIHLGQTGKYGIS